jgi:hypothetical protein
VKTAPLLLAAALLFAASVFLQRRIDERMGTFRAQEDVIYLWSGKHVKRLVPGFEGLAADIYWLRTVQYFGGQRLFAKDKRFELLEPLVEITTTLDERFEIAYRYGAIFLSEAPPVGAGRPKSGVALLEKGVAANPNAWRLRQDLGFFIHLFLGDDARAAEILNEAADIPGAAYWLRTLAADILARGGNRAASRRMWQQMYEQAEGDFIKTNAAEHLRILDALDQADRLTEAVKAYERRTGRKPARLEDLLGSGLRPANLVDPSGVPLEYDPASGVVTVSKKSMLWRVQ